MMKRNIFSFFLFGLLASCSSGSDSTPFDIITGEIEQVFTIDWRGLPANQTIPITFPASYQEVSFISIQDFDVQDADQFFDPTISAMYYDISGWDDVNSAGLFEVTISVIGNNGLPRRLTTFSISNLANTVTLNNNQVVLAKEVIYNNTEGSVVVDGLVFASQSILQGRLTLEVEIAGRNVVLQNPDRFDITLSMELSALASVND